MNELGPFLCLSMRTVILGYSTDDRCKMKLSLDIESKCIEKYEKQNLVEKLLEMT